MSEIVSLNQLIRTMKKSQNPMERAQAARGIGHLKDPEAVEALLETLADSDYEVRQAAIWALEQIRDEHLVDELINDLNHEDPEVRRGVAYVLGEIGDREAVDPLCNALIDDNLYVQKFESEDGKGKRQRHEDKKGRDQFLRKQGLQLGDLGNLVEKDERT